MSNFAALYQKLQAQFAAGDAGTNETLSQLKVKRRLAAIDP